VVDIDPKRRRFIGKIADLINARDRHCSDPFRTAPIRHHDHIIRHTDGGPSTADNGRGVCERGNYVREMPGWSVKLVDAVTPHDHHHHPDRTSIRQQTTRTPVTGKPHRSRRDQQPMAGRVHDHV